MPIIDADCHVIEAEHTWEYFIESELKYKPLTLVTDDGTPGEPRRFLAIDGRLRAETAANGEARQAQALAGRPQAGAVAAPVPASGKGLIREQLSGFSQTTEAMRTLRDIPARLRHMDALGVEIQVLYPTTMALGQISPRPEVDVAMSRSYNRWLADVWRQGGGRLRWIAVPGILDLTAALDQVRWCKDYGACGVMLRGFEGDRILSDPYFFPLYDLAQSLDLPICVHSGGANPAYASLIVDSAWSSAKVPVISAFHHILYGGIPDQFPRLRFGFIEAAAGWVPYLLTDIRRRLEREGRPPLSDSPLRDNRMYVAVQTNDDLPYVLQFAGEDNLVIGSDYGHSDTASELEALKRLQTSSPLSPEATRKILEDNPKALYGL
jgi:hypothetical protein